MSAPGGDERAVREGVPGAEAEGPRAAGVLVVRRGPGANCSSIGSAVEMLFLSATVGATVLAAVVAALRPRVAEAVDAHADEPPRGATGGDAAGASGGGGAGEATDDTGDPTEAG